MRAKLAVMAIRDAYTKLATRREFNGLCIALGLSLPPAVGMVAALSSEPTLASAHDIFLILRSIR